MKTFLLCLFSALLALPGLAATRSTYPSAGAIGTNDTALIEQGSGSGFVTRKIDFATQAPISATDLVRRGFSNIVHAAARTDGRDGIGSMLDPRDASSPTLLSNLLNSAASGTVFRFAPGRYQYIPSWAENCASDPGQTNAFVKWTGLNNVAIIGEAGSAHTVFWTTNHGTFLLASGVSNTLYQGITFDENRSPRPGTNSQTAVLGWGYDTTNRRVVIRDVRILNATQHGIVPRGDNALNEDWLIENCHVQNAGITNHATLGADGTSYAVWSHHRLVMRNNTASDTLRPIEFFASNASTSTGTRDVLVDGFQFTGAWEYGITAFANRTNLNTFRNITIRNGLITLRQATNGWGTKSAGLNWVAPVDGLTIENVVVVGGTNAAWHGSGIAVNSAQGHQHDVVLRNVTSRGRWAFRGLQTGITSYPMTNVVVDGFQVVPYDSAGSLGGSGAWFGGDGLTVRNGNIQGAVGDYLLRSRAGVNQGFERITLRGSGPVTWDTLSTNVSLSGIDYGGITPTYSAVNLSESLLGTGTNAAPSSPSTPVLWKTIRVDGGSYRIPLYQ